MCALDGAGDIDKIGFLHKIAQPKSPLVYDLQEPFRWIVDATVMSCLENKTFNKGDFFLTDKYVLKLRPPAVKRLLERLRLRFNSKVRYKGRSYSWDTILPLKTQELARFLLGRVAEIDFRNPTREYNVEDSRELREKILSLTSSQARRIGTGKTTLWNLQKRSGSRKPLQIYTKTIKRYGVDGDGR